jgi:hypothetical protein
MDSYAPLDFNLADPLNTMFTGSDNIDWVCGYYRHPLARELSLTGIYVGTHRSVFAWSE